MLETPSPTERAFAGPSAKTLAICARRYGLDLAMTALLLVSTSFAAGRVWRFPFDDETYNLDRYTRTGPVDTFLYYLQGNDVHPPLPYALGSALFHLGFGEAGLRLVSLGMTVGAFVLIHLLALTLAAASSKDFTVAPFIRCAAVLLFGLNALAISQGDALRWYPMFALLTSLAVVLSIAGKHVWSAPVYGLALATNYLGAIVILPYLAYRYVLLRRFRLREDIAFFALTGLFASSGVIASLALLVHHEPLIATQVGNSIPVALATNVLGFFGGHSLGVSQAWLIVPAVAISLWAMAASVDRRAPGNPAHFLLLVLAAVLVMPLIGFAKPRSFLYLAPIMACILVLALHRLAARKTGIAIALLCLVVAPAVAAIANIQTSTHPFKRNSVVPYGAILDLVRAGSGEQVLVVSIDDVVVWLVGNRPGFENVCANRVVIRPACRGRTYDRVVVVRGHSDLSGAPQAMQRFEESAAQAIEGRTLVATLHAGRDDDAGLKSRLTGVPLDEAIFTISVYR